jgi:lysophospholipase L1-like esterase/nicotinamidase-related amidase
MPSVTHSQCGILRSGDCFRLPGKLRDKPEFSDFGPLLPVNFGFPPTETMKALPGFRRLPAASMKSLTLALLLGLTGLAAAAPLSLTLQTRSPAGAVTRRPSVWPAERTAVIVCDMWDLHHCRNAVIRAAEMAPRMNAFLEKTREAGALIIHAPSDCMAAYKGTPARERAKAAPPAATLPDQIDEWCRQIPSEEMAVYPIDQSDGGEDDDPVDHAAWEKELVAKGLDPRKPWTRQLDAIRVDDERDAVSDRGSEIWNLLEARGIDRVLLVGVHANMCVAGRPFGLRQMARNGKQVALVRDLTDTMYNPQRWPFVSHVEGTARFLVHVEKRICPTITSDQLLGGQPFVFSDTTAGPKRLRILLLGDSTTEASIPKKLAPDEPQLEDMLRIRLALETDLPPTDVVNLGLSGEFIRRLLDSGRYDRDVAKQPAADVIFIRYGLNDRAKREAFTENFPKDFQELLARLRRDHPQALLVPTTVIPYGDPANNQAINILVRQVAEAERLPLFDIYPDYLAQLEKGPNMLNYRRYPLAKIPKELHALVTPWIRPESEPKVVVPDHRLDAWLGHLPGWFGDRHPNLAGYHVIAEATARWLIPVLRERGGK